MEALDGCALRSSSALDDERCVAGARQFARQAASIFRFWATSVELSGGVTSTKNKLEQTNLKEATWILDGAYEGLLKLYPERFDKEGNLIASCTDTATNKTVWGADKCKPIIEKYVTDKGTPTKLCKGTEECNKNVQCFVGNVGTGASKTTKTECDLVTLEHGYSQWQEKASIKCINPTNLSELVGFANCQDVKGKWEARSAYTNQDQPAFRTIGETVGKNIKDE